MNARHIAKIQSQIQSRRTTIFATLAALLRAKGSGAPFSGSRRRGPLAAVACASLFLLAAPAAQASFGLHDVGLTATNQDGSPVAQAGAHPYDLDTTFSVDTKEVEGLAVPDEDIRDLIAQLPTGLLANPTAVPRCSAADFAGGEEIGTPACPDSSVIGLFDLTFGFGEANDLHIPVYNLYPPPGVAVRFGFRPLGVPVAVDGGIAQHPPYNGFAGSVATAQAGFVYGGSLHIWGNPASPAHDLQRGRCGFSEDPTDVCPVAIAQRPFLFMPRSCSGPLSSLFETRSWQHPEDWLYYPLTSQSLGGCSRLAFSPTITAQPTSKATTSPSGLDFSLDVADPGLPNPDGLAASDIEKAEVTLPAGMSVNPSQAEGLAVCSKADLARESADSAPGAGCPAASKIGSLEVESPLLEGADIKGALYVAKPYDNLAGDSLLALYIVIKDPTLGISVTQTARIETDPETGQLTTITEDMPQLPFSHFRLHFREGARSPLVTPSACGHYDVAAKLYPYSGAPPITSTSGFEVISGPDNSPCPTGGLPPFHPNLEAGTVNNAAGAFSPFNVKLTRTDSEQEFTNFSIKLPPGIAGKLAGIPFCSDAAIAQAQGRTGPHGGQEEIDSPSCPAASYVGRTLAGAGVGPSLAYAPGKLYLAGPYHGAPLSIVSITAGVVGPFDIGTVVVRLAVKVNPETGEVFLDSTGSDPIPHIIQGIPIHLRDIRAYTDRPEFTYNPTNCEPTSTASTVLGSGLDFVSPADDNPFVATSRFQAADCASLGYQPQLSLRLRGSTKRGGNPALRAVLTPRPGDANSAAISVALPHSEFLEQGHIRTICTRVQFNAGAGNGAGCPAESIYGHAKAWTPILAEPLEGPIFLRSSEHPLPDLVLALHGLIDFNAVGRIDSVNGGIRNTFDLVPDAPISKVVVELQGGKKSLLANSRNLCESVNRATAKFKGQNGKRYNARPVLKVKCGKKAKKKHKGNKRHARAAR